MSGSVIDVDDDRGDHAAYTRGKRGRPQKGNKNPESQETEESQASLTAALGVLEVEEEEVVQPISPKAGRLSRQSSGNNYCYSFVLCFADLLEIFRNNGSALGCWSCCQNSRHEEDFHSADFHLQESKQRLD
jgi:hypothetical protein